MQVTFSHFTFLATRRGEYRLRKIVRARAPFRISFGGGGTDVAPYSDERGGLVLNATINRYAYVTIAPNDTGTVALCSLDYGDTVSYPASEGVPSFDGRMDLAKGVIRRLRVDGAHGGFSLYTHADCPPGSGLGASSTMVVALVGAFNEWLQLGLDRYEIALLAYEIERNDVGIRGGKQDQYAAAFGGFNFMEFHGDKALINPLRIPSESVSELEYSLVLAYTGQSRLSSKIIDNQMENYRVGREDAIRAMDRTKQSAVNLKRALLTGNFVEFGELLHEGWNQKKQMSDQISNEFIEELYGAARGAGAVGGKISGAGGGGFMFFFAQFDRRHQVIEALRKHGAQIFDFGFTDTGLQTWTR